mgnify:CR=1 FL=1
MNFNTYLKKEIAEQVTKLAKKLQRSRNSIISEALEQWLERYQKSKWPKGFFDFEPLEDLPDFKGYRNELKSISEDPLQ